MPMNLPRIVLALALLATPALAQDASSSSPLVEPSASAEPSSSAPQPPQGLSDGELEMAVRAAYSGAAAFAAAHGNYFARDGVFAPLRDAVAAASASAYPSVVVPADIAADLDAAKVCLAAPGTELRIEARDGQVITCRLFLVKQRLYIVVAKYPRSGRGRGVDTFFDSFALTEN